MTDSEETPAIEMEQVAVVKLGDVGENAGLRVDVGDHRLAVVRAGDEVRVLADRCSHANYSLAEGEIVCKDMTIECWKHGALFSLDTGEALTLPALRPVAVYKAEVIDGEVMVMLPKSTSDDEAGRE